MDRLDKEIVIATKPVFAHSAFRNHIKRHQLFLDFSVDKKVVLNKFCSLVEPLPKSRGDSPVVSGS